VPTLHEALTLAHEAARTGDRTRARFIYEQILKTVPDEPNALNGLGMVLREAGQPELAESHIRRAIAGFPGEAAFHNNLYLVLRDQGRAAEAVASCRDALKLNPQSPELHNNLGTALKANADLEAAVSSFRVAIELAPGYADAHYNLANALVMLRRLDEAETEYRRAVKLAPGDGDVHNNLGTLLRLTGRLAEAAQCYETALACRADFAEAHRNRASLRLLLGEFDQGWPEYEWRWRMDDAPRPRLSRPRWQGETLAGRTILLWSEQGLGDTIQFIRYAPLLQRMGARVLIDCPVSLRTLLASAPGIDAIVAGDAEQEAFDYYIPLLSLPAACHTTMATIPAEVPYLHAEPDRVEHWRRVLSTYKEFKVGIAWQGSRGFTGDYYRSVPLAHFAPLAASSGVRLFSLQKGHGREQLPPLVEPLRIADLDASLDVGAGAFVDTAAVIKNLDLVITSDTSVAHLAGALGVGVWVALQQTPNWRWLMDRTDSPWYPSMRLFRQSRLGDWGEVFARIADALRIVSSAAADETS
jgi:Flp pilus assembly protein TadD